MWYYCRILRTSYRKCTQTKNTSQRLYAKDEQKMSIDNVIERMKQATDSQTDAELARFLGISARSVISSWRSRNKKPYAECERIANLTGVSFEWLITGHSVHNNGQDLPPIVGKITDMVKDMPEEAQREMLLRVEDKLKAIERQEEIDSLKQEILKLKKSLRSA